MKYICLLRGINVGGKHIVKMAALKQMFADMGYRDVRTYIQSGNVAFEADGAEDSLLCAIRDRFEATFGFPCAALLRTGDEIARIHAELPFTPEEIRAAEAVNPDVEHLYVYFLDGAPPPDAVERLCAAHPGPDLLRPGRRELVLLCHQSVRDSKLANALIKLGLPMTARNWNTVGKLLDMLR